MVRDTRTRLGLTQAELAARIGASRYWVVAFEAGKPGAELGLVLKALRALGLRVEITPAAPRPAAAAEADTPSPESPSEVLDRLRALVASTAPKERVARTRPKGRGKARRR
jgi:DNA-binding XRE family transcriptional regulator